ncbi:transcription factor bHLH95-like [Salvia miltiorrhiza]|uniref:transcription factor bHLH95-like n=1 Tax=Salvia miltiorrhiza TaxID=226208 RepID=UPI0025ABB543|nr:transcription factor bHLH95-like [Salvia miltiorrhiza]
MLAMGEELGGEGLLWDDDQSWEFPKLAKSADISNLAAKDKEAPPPPEKGKKRSAAARGESELHILTERERRKKMRDMFSNLHALLPHIPPKAEKWRIVDEAVKYISKLQQSVDQVERRRALGEGEIFKTWSFGNVILNVCGRDAHMSVCSIRKPGVLAAVCFMVEKNNLELLSAHTASGIYMIHARAYEGTEQAFPIEQNFKQAAAEIMMWLHS